ncbi:hypothetical protein GCM10022222_54900 [Amycolatopsis ultiminotia]|uniref:Carrier domain-containing protein n=1 Tax=Amycolatopsis ultiminotia TaxID=543629 RepID=A0ABP6XAN4_9PSEU
MGKFELTDLAEVMRSSVGVEEGVDLDGPIGEVEFTALGYDSLAMAEVISQINRRFGVQIPEEEAFDLLTPNAVVEAVSSRLVEAVR